MAIKIPAAMPVTIVERCIYRGIDERVRRVIPIRMVTTPKIIKINPSIENPSFAPSWKLLRLRDMSPLADCHGKIAPMQRRAPAMIANQAPAGVASFAVGTVEPGAACRGPVSRA